MPLFQNESKCETFYAKMSSACGSFPCESKSFHKNGFAVRLALKQRQKGARKWPIVPQMIPGQELIPPQKVRSGVDSMKIL